MTTKARISEPAPHALLEWQEGRGSNVLYVTHDAESARADALRRNGRPSRTRFVVGHLLPDGLNCPNCAGRYCVGC